MRIKIVIELSPTKGLGPLEWPWWRWVAIERRKLPVHKPARGRRTWLVTRNLRIAMFIDVVTYPDAWFEDHENAPSEDPRQETMFPDG